ncbi:MAG: GNAT family N-acetyltransferase [Oricola sp.]
MSDTILDRPVWGALTTAQSDLALGSGGARRFPADISPFIVARDDCDESLAGMADLAREGETVVLLQREPSPLPPGFMQETEAPGVQMVAVNLRSPSGSHEVIPLGDADAPEMLELATMTKPGPFLANTHRLGGFIGIRHDGRLAAMAGERLKPGNFCEISAVCTHPDFRGRGYAGLLTQIVAARIAGRGQTPFLHTYASNATAIRLYEKLGFRHRCAMTVQVMKRA